MVKCRGSLVGEEYSTLGLALMPVTVNPREIPLSFRPVLVAITYPVLPDWLYKALEVSFGVGMLGPGKYLDDVPTEAWANESCLVAFSP